MHTPINVIYTYVICTYIENLSGKTLSFCFLKHQCKLMYINIVYLNYLCQFVCVYVFIFNLVFDG